MSESYTNLYVIELEERKGMNYRYLVRHNHSAFTAFRTLGGLLKWVKMAGLEFGNTWEHDKRITDLIGTFTRVMLMDTDLFNKMRQNQVGYEDVILSNGDYTTCIVVPGPNGNTAYYLNPNCEREVHEHAKHHN